MAFKTQFNFRLPRGYVDEAGNLDQGVLFMAFNKIPHTQFAVIQQRLEA